MSIHHVEHTDHAERVPNARWWAKAAFAGLVGGGVFALYTMIATWNTNDGFWWPINLVGATLPAYRPPMYEFAAGPSLTGMALHLLNTVVWGLLYGAIAASLFPKEARSWLGATMLGLGWGIVVYTISGALIGPRLDPFLIWVPQNLFFVGHLIYGVVTALVFCALTRNKAIHVVFLREDITVEERPRVGPML